MSARGFLEARLKAAQARYDAQEGVIGDEADAIRTSALQEILALESSLQSLNPQVPVAPPAAAGGSSGGSSNSNTSWQFLCLKVLCKSLFAGGL